MKAAFWSLRSTRRCACGKDKMIRRFLSCAALVLSLASSPAFGQAVPAFNPSGLVKLGDAVRYGSYEVIRIGDRIYQLKDSGDPRAQKGGLIGTDMYLVCGTTKALLVDLGNNYIDGYVGDAIVPRRNAAEELRAVVDGLRGSLPLEAAITHAHPDHDGMTRAFLDQQDHDLDAEGRGPRGPEEAAQRSTRRSTPPSTTRRRRSTWEAGAW